MTLRKAAALLLSFSGVIIVATGGSLRELSGVDVMGVAACLLSAACYALFSVLNIMVTMDKFVAMMVYYTVSAVASLGCLMVQGFALSLNPLQLGGMLWNGMLVSGVAYTVWAIALDNGDTAKISNLAYITPFVSLVYIYLLLDEAIAGSSFVGLFFILIGVCVQMDLKKSMLAARDFVRARKNLTEEGDHVQ